MTLTRRQLLQQLGATAGVAMLPLDVIRGQEAPIIVAGKPVEIAVFSVSPDTVRITVRPVGAGTPEVIPYTGALVVDEFGAPRQRSMAAASLKSIRAGNLTVSFTEGPPVLIVQRGTTIVQKLTLDAAAPGMSFLLPKGPLLGLGEGGVQFDRKGSTDQMRNGQVTSEVDGYRLAIHGTRMPIQWLVGTDGWAMFIHQPYGSFDFKGAEGKFTPHVPGQQRGGQSPPAAPAATAPAATAAPQILDVFVVGATEPAAIMREYSRITGLPEMPPMWAFGYQQSSRTLAGPEEILGVAKTFREKKLPCDTLIYLGTEFTPSGWNTRNGEFTWHKTNFPDPKGMIDTLHADHFKVVVHVVIEGRQLIGRVSDPCTAEPLPPGRTPDNRWPPSRQVSCYWPVHKEILDVGVDGFWPDQGDGFDGPSRFNRHRMYYEGTQMYRPNERPYALHRNASAGVQRFGGFIWSGDVQTRWETLKVHVPVAINTALSGLPFWGTDIGGFNPTEEYTPELHLRWFQFGTFNPLMRAHGRQWHLRLPWGWDGGDGGPVGDGAWKVNPDDLKSPHVEVISRKYLELRYRLMPYLQTAVRETHETGLPIMRALWLHYAGDPVAVARGDEYLWGRDIIVAPVVEKGATSRKVYLPRGTWVDYWTEKPEAGGREIDREVDLATMPLYVRAGAVIPHGPVRQYVDEPTTEPMTLVIYPGTDGESIWYEDDGRSFRYRQGQWMKVVMNWRDTSGRLTLDLMPGGRMLPPMRRQLVVRVAGTSRTRTVTFEGRRLVVDL
jgi:alpha-glucosidase (family GH31 glycosyl hydrolase)